MASVYPSYAASLGTNCYADRAAGRLACLAGSPVDDTQPAASGGANASSDSRVIVQAPPAPTSWASVAARARHQHLRVGTRSGPLLATVPSNFSHDDTSSSQGSVNDDAAAHDPAIYGRKVSVVCVSARAATRPHSYGVVSQPPLAVHSEQPAAMPNVAVTSRHVVRDAHMDDIHGLLNLPGNSFVSSSKDGHLNVWSTDGSFLRTVRGRSRLDYTKWVTAICALSGLAPNAGHTADSGIFAYATRDGRMEVLDSVDGSCRMQRFLDMRDSGHWCKTRNANRVTCMAFDAGSTALDEPRPPRRGPRDQNDLQGHLYVGSPTCFRVYDLNTGDVVGTQITSSNDWVYTITPVGGSFSSVLVATGASLDLWSSSSTASRTRDAASSLCWTRTCRLLDEPRHRRRAACKPHISAGAQSHQRPFISAVTQLEGGNAALYGLALFDGSIRIVDISTGRETARWQEHTGRTWAVENLSHSLFATGADDHCMKLWDPRCPRSVHTVTDQIGRVSTLLRVRMDPATTWVSGCCSDDLSQHGAPRGQLNFWDLRVMPKPYKVAAPSVEESGVKYHLA